MKYSLDDIADFVRKESGYSREITEDTTLQHDIGLFGDDICEFLKEYSNRFAVNMAKYLWYFHTGEEGWNIGSLFFKSPDQRVKQIPITIGMLCDFANSGAWLLDYPEHNLPKYRIDIFINFFVIIAFLVLLAILAIWKWL